MSTDIDMPKAKRGRPREGQVDPGSNFHMRTSADFLEKLDVLCNLYGLKDRTRYTRADVIRMLVEEEFHRAKK